jgi:hypothetical protein
MIASWRKQSYYHSWFYMTMSKKSWNGKAF